MVTVATIIQLVVPPVLTHWMSSFLCDRQQRVKLSDCFSDWLTLKGGMPQGSFMGPLTFLVLINDLTTACLVHKFVDDTTLSEIIPNDDVSHMEAFLVDIIRWSQDNLMRVNWNKTKEMLLGPIAKQQIPDLSVDDMSRWRSG